MRLLFVTPHPPSHIRVRSYGFLKHLLPGHDITIATQCASGQELANVEHLRAQGFTVEAVWEAKRQEVLRSGMALFSRLPLQVAYARSARFAHMVGRLCSERTFDVVHVEHLRGIASMQNLSSSTPLVWDAVDCISLLCEQTMKAGPSLPVRAVASLEYQRTRRYEANQLARLRHVVVTSERDRQAMLGLLEGTNGRKEEQQVGIEVLPNGVDLEYFRPGNRSGSPRNIVFLGKMSYHANVAAALYLGRHIMPVIWRLQPETTLTIAGSNPPKAVRALEIDSRVKVTGYVDDVRPFVQRSAVMLCPMTYSVGIQNKVLEAMAMGTPVVVTAQAAASLQAIPGRDVLVAHSTQEFAELALGVMHDEALRAALRWSGRRYVEQYHDWSVVSERLVDIYRQAMTCTPGLGVGSELDLNLASSGFSHARFH
jgi:glycosyltransferase involved in cell wall biosynthesis